MSEKTEKDKEFFRDVWGFMTGSEGYFMAAWFWAASIVVAAFPVLGIASLIDWAVS